MEEAALLQDRSHTFGDQQSQSPEAKRVGSGEVRVTWRLQKASYQKGVIMN